MIFYIWYKLHEKKDDEKKSCKKEYEKEWQSKIFYTNGRRRENDDKIKHGKREREENRRRS